MSWYRTGTIALTNGSTAVVGTGTDFINGVAIGEGVLAPDGKVYEIASVQSATALTLGSAYLGSTATGQTYAVIPSQSYIRDLASQAATLINSYQAVKDGIGSGKFPDGTAALPGFSFTANTNTGIRRVGTNSLALVAGGADKLTVAASLITLGVALSVTGSITASNGGILNDGTNGVLQFGPTSAVKIAGGAGYGGLGLFANSTQIATVSSTGLAVTGAVSASGQFTTTAAAGGSGGFVPVAGSWGAATAVSYGADNTNNAFINTPTGKSGYLNVNNTPVLQWSTAGVSVTGSVSATPSTTTNPSFLRAGNANGWVTFGVEGSVAGASFAGTSGYYAHVAAPAGAGINFVTNATTAATLDTNGYLNLAAANSRYTGGSSTGYALFGNTEVASYMQVYGSAGSIPYAIGFVTGGVSRLVLDGTTLTLPNSSYYAGKIASGATTRLLGINASNTLYIGAIDATATGGISIVNNGVSQLSQSAIGRTWTLAGGTDTAGTGFGFPATQAASSDPNTLDDYEEGSWTPVLGGTATYTVNAGRYVKIGRQVTVTGTISVNVLGTGSASVIQGLPFASSPEFNYSASIGYWASTASAFACIIGTCGSATNITLYSATSATGTLLNNNVFQNGTRVDFSMTYNT